eukprot:287861-Rhodomonas_salina.2
MDAREGMERERGELRTEGRNEEWEGRENGREEEPVVSVAHVHCFDSVVQAVLLHLRILQPSITRRDVSAGIAQQAIAHRSRS